jgi:hypothetical protein
LVVVTGGQDANLTWFDKGNNLWVELSLSSFPQAKNRELLKIKDFAEMTNKESKGKKDISDVAGTHSEREGESSWEWQRRIELLGGGGKEWLRRSFFGVGYKVGDTVETGAGRETETG